MSSPDIVEVVVVVVPVVLAGLTHVAVIRTGALTRLAAIPIDGGLRLGDRRLLGENKTVRGVVAMVLGGAMWSLALTAIPWDGPSPAPPWTRFATAHPVGWGSLLELGWVAGELPNSFLKRRLGVPPGAAVAGRLRPLGWLVDQVDSLVGVLAAASLVHAPRLTVVVWLLFLTLALHPLVALLMVGLGLSRAQGPGRLRRRWRPAEPGS